MKREGVASSLTHISASTAGERVLCEISGGGRVACICSRVVSHHFFVRILLMSMKPASKIEHQERSWPYGTEKLTKGINGPRRVMSRGGRRACGDQLSTMMKAGPRLGWGQAIGEAIKIDCLSSS